MPRKKKKASSKKGGSAAPPATPENAAADEQKGKGNQAFVRGDFAHAVTCFSKAIALSPDHPQVHMFFGNRSAAQCKLGEFAEAIRDGDAEVVLGYYFHLNCDDFGDRLSPEQRRDGFEYAVD